MDAVAVGLGAIVGAGIFVVTSQAAGLAGPAFILGLILAATIATFNALSSAELAAKFPTSGGTYEYGYELLHPAAGFAAGWMFLASKLAAGGTVAIGFGAYLSQLIPAFPAKAAGVVAVVLLTAANLFGIRKAGRLNLAIVAITIASLVAFAVLGVGSVKMANFEPFAPQGWVASVQAAGLLFFAYTGYARIATLAEEVQDPERTIPRAVVLSLGIAVGIYLLVAFVATGVAGTEALAKSAAPLSVAAVGLATPGVDLIIGIGAATAMLGVLLSQILGISRMMLAMARRGDLPGFLSGVSGRHSVPTSAILVTGTVILILAIFGSLVWIVSAATFTILLYYTVTNLAAMRLNGEEKRFPTWIAWAGLISCLGLASFLDWTTILAGIGLLAVGFGLRATLHRWSQSRTDRPKS